MSEEKSNLEKKYLYLPKIMRDKNNKKHYNNSQRFFKEIYHYDDKICKIKKKIDASKRKFYSIYDYGK